MSNVQNAVSSKVTCEITVDFAAFDRASRLLARVGERDGNAFVRFGESIAELLKKSVPLPTIYNRGIANGVHDFADMKALYEASNAWTFSQWAKDNLEMDCAGLKRAFYKTLSTLQRKCKKSKMDKTSTRSIMQSAIIDARNMSYVEHRAKYLPGKAKSDDESDVEVYTPGAVDASDCFELNAGNAELPCTRDGILARIRALTVHMMELDKVNGLNDVLDVVTSLDNSTAVESDVDAIESAVA